MNDDDDLIDELTRGQRAQERNGRFLTVQYPANPVGEPFFEDTLKSPGLSPEETVLRQQALVTANLYCTDERNRRILLDYYFTDKLAREIGFANGVSESRISQILAAEVGKIRAQFRCV